MTQASAKTLDGAAVPARLSRPAEFAAQFQASFRVLWLVAVGILGDGALAEDVVQDAAVIALGKLDQFQPGTNFTAWMGQIVRNVALNRGRRERRHRPTAMEPNEMPAAAGALAAKDASLFSVFDARLVRALQGIGDTARACLLLRTLDGMEYSQIARLLGIPEGTAMSHVHRSRRTLRERLSDLGSDGDPEAQGGR